MFAKEPYVAAAQLVNAIRSTALYGFVFRRKNINTVLMQNNLFSKRLQNHHTIPSECIKIIKNVFFLHIISSFYFVYMI